MIPDLSRWIRPGDHILWGQVTGEPPTLVEALVAQRHALGGVTLFLGTGLSDTLRPEHADAFRFTGLGGLGTTRRLAGALEVLPVHGGQVDALIRAGRIQCDVALLMLPPAGPDGTHSLGACVDYMEAAVATARVVLAEISDKVPDTGGHARVPPARLAATFRTDRAPLGGPAPEPTPAERAIGAHLAPLIPDGATLQTGLGALPEAILAALRGHRDLGLHTGLMGDGAHALIEGGALTNARKSVDAGISVTTTLVGGPRLHGFAHRNPAVELRPCSHTHDAAVLARHARLFAVNSAAEVDLTGQANSESVAGRLVGGIGGQADFARAASRSPGGASVIALPASRIIARLRGPVTTPRADVDIVVTEHGAADLRGATLAERTHRIIAVAAPDARDELERAAREEWR